MKNLKKLQKIFIERIIATVTELNGVSITPEIDSWKAQWLIETKYGILKITLPKKHDILFTVFCKFQSSVEVFSKFDTLRINKYSGKWNFHYSDGDDSWRMFQFELDSIASDNNTIERFCVPQSSIFTMELQYDRDKIYKTLIDNGAVNLEVENYFFQSNLPPVVTFYLEASKKSKMADKLNEAFDSEWIRVENLEGWEENKEN